MSLTAAFTGVLSLAALEVTLSSPRAIGALGGAATGLQGSVDRFLSPDVGLIPNLHDDGAPKAGSSAAGAGAGGGTTLTRKQINRRIGKQYRVKGTGRGRKPIVAPPVHRAPPGAGHSRGELP